MAGALQPGRKSIKMKSKEIKLTNNELGLLIELLRKDLNLTVAQLKRAPIEADTDILESEAEGIWELIKRLEACREELQRQIFGSSAWVNGID